MSTVNHKKLKVLLMQIRQEPEVLVSELNGFALYSALEVGCFDVLDVFKNPSLESIELDEYDALMVGGSSSASVLEPEKYPFVLACQNILKDAIVRKVPTFASCFGFQLAVKSLGGDILRSPEGQFEMGVVPIHLAEHAGLDPVFKGMSDSFPAVSVHREKCVRLPPHCQLLAYTKECVHAFKYEGSPFWAFQFHPEVDQKELHYRLNLYIQKYGSQEQLQKTLEESAPTPEANSLLKNFVQYVFSLKYASIER